MLYTDRRIDIEAQELARQKKSQRRINILLLVIDLALLAFVIYEIVEKFVNM